MSDMQGMRVKPWEVAVQGYPAMTYYGVSRGKVIADAWRCDAFYHLPFEEFLRIVQCRREDPAERYGERFTISGRPARYISHNRQYVQFVFDGHDTVLNTHPLDIDQPEARRGTPYYTPTAGIPATLPIRIRPANRLKFGVRVPSRLGRPKATKPE